MKKIVILSTLDTKAEETAYLKKQIEVLGQGVMLMDIGYGGKPGIAPDISREEILKASNTSEAEFERLDLARNREALSQIVCRGAAEKLKKLVAEDAVRAVISIGGTSSAVMASAIIRELHYSIPQLIFTTAASLPSSYRFFGPSGVTVMHSLVEVGGLNYILREQLKLAAGAICGMAASAGGGEKKHRSKMRIAMTTNGWCEKSAHYLLEKLSGKFEIVRFHAIGQPEVVMEKLIEAGDFDAVIDLVPSSITNDKFNGTRISWERRLTVAGEIGIPQIIAPNLINVISRMRADTPEQIEEASRRKHYYVDNLRILLWLTREETLDMAPVYAEKLNKSTGITKFLFPMRGWVSLETEDSGLFEPEVERAFVEKLRGLLKPGIEIIEVDANINDTVFAEAVIRELENALAETSI